MLVGLCVLTGAVGSGAVDIGPAHKRARRGFVRGQALMGIDRRALTLPAFVTLLIPSRGSPAMASCGCGLPPRNGDSRLLRGTPSRVLSSWGPAPPGGRHRAIGSRRSYACGRVGAAQSCRRGSVCDRCRSWSSHQRQVLRHSRFLSCGVVQCGTGLHSGRPEKSADFCSARVCSILQRIR